MKKFAVEIRWGIRYIFAYIAWAFLEKAMGVYDENLSQLAFYSLGFYAFGLIIYILALTDKKNHVFNGSMDWKQGCVSGVYMSIVIGLLMPVVQLLIHQVIAPELLPNMIKNVVDKGHMTAELAAENYNLTSYMMQGIFFALSIGVLFSALAALIVRNKKS